MEFLTNLEFEYAYFLALPLFFIFLQWRFPYRSVALYFPHLELFHQSRKMIDIVPFIKWLGLINLSIALASPFVANKTTIKKNIGYDIALCMDISGSMERPFYNDNTISKFAATKDILSNFVQKRQTDNIAAVAFGKYSFVVSPLSFDKNSLTKILNDIRIYDTIKEGTAIGDCIAQAVNLLKAGEAKNRFIILATDGSESQNINITFDKASTLAKKYGIKVYAIGIVDIYGDLNRGILKYIAEETGGDFFIADSKNTLKQIYTTIDKLEKSKIRSQDFHQRNYYYNYPLALALVCLSLFFFYRYRN